MIKVILTDSKSYNETVEVSKVHAVKDSYLLKITSINKGARDPEAQHVRHQVIVSRATLRLLAYNLDMACLAACEA